MIKYTVIAWLFIYSSACAGSAHDSVDNVAYRMQQKSLREDPYIDLDKFDADHHAWRQMQNYKGSWRWSVEEYMDFSRRASRLMPEYYKSEELGSNDGYTLT